MAKKGKNKQNSYNKQENKPSRNNEDKSKRQKNARVLRGKKLKGNGASDAQLFAAVEADGTKTIVKMSDDGNCLFRSISDQLYYDHGNGHADVRAEVCDYLEAHEEDFSGFLVLDSSDENGGHEEGEDAADFASYVRAMRRDGEWGGNLELVVAARLYRRNIVVFSANLAALTIDHGSGKKPSGPDLLISYHDNQHYNSVRDNATPKPPPPVKSFVRLVDEADGEAPEKGSATSRECHDDAVIEPTEAESKKQDGHGLEKEDQIDQTHAKPKITKKAQCPCGSGLRYKKCCLVKEKHAARVQNLQEQQGVRSEDEQESEVQGAFRVLKI